MVNFEPQPIANCQVNFEPQPIANCQVNFKSQPIANCQKFLLLLTQSKCFLKQICEVLTTVHTTLHHHDKKSYVFTVKCSGEYEFPKELFISNLF